MVMAKASPYTKSVLLRLTEKEHADLVAKASAAGKTLNSYMRGELLGGLPAPVSTPSYVTANAALGKQVQTLSTAVNFLAGGQIAKAQAILGGEEPEDGNHE